MSSEQRSDFIQIMVTRFTGALQVLGHHLILLPTGRLKKVLGVHY